jgi:putative transposase
MMYPLVRELAAEKIPVAVTCRVLGFSPQAYYKWLAQPVSQRDWDDAHLINAAYDIHADDPAFGYRFIADELREQGFTAGENRIARLCSAQRIWSVFAKKPGLNRTSGPPVHDDLVDRQFTAPAPNLLWLTDITEHRTGEGKLYLCAIKGRLVQPHRRLLHRLPNDVPSGCRRARQRRRRTVASTAAIPPAASFTATAGRNFDHERCRVC